MEEAWPSRQIHEGPGLDVSKLDPRGWYWQSICKHSCYSALMVRGGLSGRTHFFGSAVLQFGGRVGTIAPCQLSGALMCARWCFGCVVIIYVEILPP